ncbi:glycosyltransferase family A protein [Pseudoduganella sp. LjRoot289]|uniref:glycosyltransferase family A protein n=1 Tax=Pseudoduganella sp. LjRoot289 TaxID=3342314 RepID=UPI003ED1003E
MKSQKSTYMVSETSDVTVIVPSTAQLSRQAEIGRCIRSIRTSSALPVQIIVVVNGTRFDQGICDWLKAQPDVQFVYAELGSAPNAVLEGRRLVRTPYFSFLDDDDEYLPGATDLKRAELLSHPGADLVVTNAFRRCGMEERVLYSHLREVAQQPLLGLFDGNWLHNGNALFRTSAVDTEYFTNYKPYAEWTWLAFKLAMAGKTVHTLEQPTFRVHVTPGSLSQSDAYFAHYLQLYDSMLAAHPPAAVQHIIRRRISAALHDYSERALERAQGMDALRYHLRSLLQPGGLRYLGYTRHVLWHLLRNKEKIA